ncbi:transposase [Candidatus Tisiphia endosymbiont of Oplodontha viridula]|uniref:transposase n=1 Tax=Candidatus Tisiphia endosymbiont of Oplodontha viridula TaxID=3077925 RepID=UPI0035C8B8E1
MYGTTQECKEKIILDRKKANAVTYSTSAGYKKDSQDQEALGRSKGGFTTKIHALVDALGNPLKFILTAGQRHDITQGNSLVKDIKNTMLLADKAYDSNAFIEQLEEQDCIAVIPSKKNRKQQKEYDKRIKTTIYIP